MALFGFGKKKEEKAPSCCCNGNTETFEAPADSCCCNEECCEVTTIKVLGAGCASCHQQYEHAKEAIKTMGLAVEVEYITDLQKVMEYGVMSMPAIVVNEKVVSTGKILKAAEVETLLHKLGF